MLILNTSFHVHTSLDDQFKAWVRRDYIPSAMTSGLLSSPRFAALLIEVQEDCVSYAVSFEAETAENAVKWHDGEGPHCAVSFSAVSARVLYFYDLHGRTSFGMRAMADSHDKIIIGIDPGTNVMGYGILGIKERSPN